mgnify:CR=1 FL=1
MNESYADMRVLGDFATSVPYMTFAENLRENTIKTSHSWPAPIQCHCPYNKSTDSRNSFPIHTFPIKHLFAITSHYRFSIVSSAIFFYLLGTVNHFLLDFRGSPFQLADIRSAGTAMNVAET